MGQARFGNPNYYLDVDAQLVSQDMHAKTSRIYWRIMVVKTYGDGFMATTNNGNKGWADSSVGGFPDLWQNNNLAYDFRNGSYNGSWVFADGHFTVQHRPDGTAEYYVNGRMDLFQLGSAETGTGWRNLPRLARVPDAPTPLFIDQISVSHLHYVFRGNGDGGTPVREWQALWQEGNGPQIGAWSNGELYLHERKPATWYNFWSRGRNDVGWGPWSNVMSARTNAGVMVRHNGQWREAVAYVRHQGRWRAAEPFVRHQGRWRRTK